MSQKKSKSLPGSEKQLFHWFFIKFDFRTQDEINLAYTGYILNQRETLTQNMSFETFCETRYERSVEV